MTQSIEDAIRENFEALGYPLTDLSDEQIRAGVACTARVMSGFGISAEEAARAMNEIARKGGGRKAEERRGMTSLDRVWQIARVSALAEFYYREFDNPTGGSLHVVLDDGNLDDGCVKYCRDFAAAEKDYLGVALAELLLELTEEEREQVREALRRVPAARK